MFRDGDFPPPVIDETRVWMLNRRIARDVAHQGPEFGGRR